MLPDHIKSIVFDAYGTLFDVRTLNQRLKTHFGNKSEQINEIWRRKQLEYSWLRALMQRYASFSQVTAEALNFACESLQIPLSLDVREKLVQGYYEIAAYEKVRQQIPDLSKAFRLAVLSNADEAMLVAAIRNSGFEPYFSRIFSVNAIGTYKPDPRVYQMVAEGLGLLPDEIAFVSSNTWDVAGAKAFGFYVCWLDHFGGTTDRLGVKPDQIIKNLSGLH